MVGIQPKNGLVWNEETCQKIYDDLIDPFEVIFGSMVIRTANDQSWGPPEIFEILVIDFSKEEDVYINTLVVENGELILIA